MFPLYTTTQKEVYNQSLTNVERGQPDDPVVSKFVSAIDDVSIEAFDIRQECVYFGARRGRATSYLGSH